MSRFGAIEAGGTKFVCLVGSTPGDVAASARFATTMPGETLGRAVSFFREHGPIEALGVACFGPVELRRGHPRYGHVTTTPKPGWPDADVVGPLQDALGVPVGFDSDVNGAALGEGRWGAASGYTDFVYVTVGTGIGGAAVVNGRAARGLVHAEMGHVPVPRRAGDAFAGSCPYHGDCLEGMASGPAVAARWGRPAHELAGPSLEDAVTLVAAYLASGLRTLVYVLAPQRIVVGGGLAALPGLFPALRRSLAAELAGYPGLAEHEDEAFVVPSSLGGEAGAYGALILAEAAAGGERRP